VGTDSLANAAHGALNLVTSSFQHSGALFVVRDVERDRSPVSVDDYSTGRDPLE